MEKPSIQARGQAAPDPFGTRDEMLYMEVEQPDKPVTAQELRSLSFEQTTNSVYFRRKEVQGNLTGIEVRIGDSLCVVKPKTTAQYLSEGLRTAAIEMREIVSDLTNLSKMLAKQ
jgi:hypothetical protein